MDIRKELEAHRTSTVLLLEATASVLAETKGQVELPAGVMADLTETTHYFTSPGSVEDRADGPIQVSPERPKPKTPRKSKRGKGYAPSTGFNKQDLSFLKKVHRTFENPKTRRPVLKDTLVVDNGKGGATIIVRDFERHVTYDVDVRLVDWPEEGMVVSMPAFERLVLANDTIMKAEADTGQVHISGASYSAVHGREYPLPNWKAGEELASILQDSQELEAIYKNVGPAVSKEAEDPRVTGILMDFREDTMFVVSSDKRRLHISHVPSLGMSDQSWIVDARAFKLACHVAGKMRIGFYGDKTVFLSEHGIRITGCNVTGEYPNYRAINPSTDYHKCEVKKSDLVRLAELKPVAKENSDIVTFTAKDGKLILSCAATQVGTSSIEIEAAGAINSMVAMNYKYVLEAIKAIDAEYIVMQHGQMLQPVFFNAKGDDGMHRNIVMPVRTE